MVRRINSTAMREQGGKQVEVAILNEAVGISYNEKETDLIKELKRRKSQLCAYWENMHGEGTAGSIALRQENVFCV